MNKTIKRTLWVIGTVIALFIILFVWYGIKASSEVKKMSPAETGQVADSIYTIKDSFVNIYLIKSGNSYIGIDGGNSIEGIKAGLIKLNISPDDVVTILLTHTDGDHVKAMSLFPKASIYISKQEEQMVTGKKSRFLFFKNSKLDRPYNVLNDNQEINLLNIKIKGILVPGHTPGSMCYLINDKYLFTGDALSLRAGKIGGFNEFFNMDTKTALQSMKKLTNIENAEYIFTAHHGFTNNYKEAVKDWAK
jgi:glyoxylase-like metal-dependent hydrolase (beta-lactamase superfamily II)